MNPWEFMTSALGWILGLWVVGSLAIFVVRDLVRDWRGED